MKAEPSRTGTICPKVLAGRLRTGCIKLLLPLLLLLMLPAVVQAQYTYTINNGAITITGSSRLATASPASIAMRSIPAPA